MISKCYKAHAQNNPGRTIILVILSLAKEPQTTTWSCMTQASHGHPIDYWRGIFLSHVCGKRNANCTLKSLHNRSLLYTFMKIVFIKPIRNFTGTIRFKWNIRTHKIWVGLHRVTQRLPYPLFSPTRVGRLILCDRRQGTEQSIWRKGWLWFHYDLQSNTFTK